MLLLGRSKLVLQSLLVIGLLMCASASAQEVSKEYQVKAAFIYNFVQFVEWPANAVGNEKNPIVIGVVGENPFGDVLTKITQGKQAAGHPLVVRQFRLDEDLRAAHVLFISNSLSGQMREIIGKVRTAPVLTIGDDQDFNAAGGIIRFFIEEGKVRFEVNIGVAEKASLKISSKLLRLATIYKP